MAYSTPKTWAHGDTVPAAEMQKYSDGLDAIRPKIEGVLINWAQPYSQMEEAQFHTIWHKQRWLIYSSTGLIRHVSDTVANPDVSLSDTGGICVFDLEQGVDWLVPGMLYYVIGCSLAFEDEFGEIV